MFISYHDKQICSKRISSTLVAYKLKCRYKEKKVIKLKVCNPCKCPGSYSFSFLQRLLRTQNIISKRLMMEKPRKRPSVPPMLDIMLMMDADSVSRMRVVPRLLRKRCRLPSLLYISVSLFFLRANMILSRKLHIRLRASSFLTYLNVIFLYIVVSFATLSKVTPYLQWG